MSAVLGTHAARQVNLTVARSPSAKAFGVDGFQIAVFRPIGRGVRRASCARNVRSPTAGRQHGKVVCPFHAYRFDLATGCPEGNTCAPLTTYPAGLTGGGEVVVTLGGR